LSSRAMSARLSLRTESITHHSGHPSIDLCCQILALWLSISWECAEPLAALRWRRMVMDSRH
jgi:hypothetical protein